MPIPLNIIYSYFKTNEFPTQQQFEDSWSSFWHKGESIPTNKIIGLDNLLQNKTDKNIFETHISNPDSHANYLAKKDASNLSNENVQSWKTKLGVGSLPPNIATVDAYDEFGNISEFGNVYTRVQSNDMFMSYGDYTDNNGNILAEKIEALGLTTLIEVVEATISEFAEHSGAYVFEDNDFIAIPVNKDNYSLYMFKGGEKTDKSNYLPTGISNVTIGMVEGLQSSLNGKVDKPAADGKFYIKRQSGVTTTELLADETLKSVVNRGNYTPKSIKFGEETDPYYFGINKTNFNLYITKKDPDTDPATGIVNVGVGFQSLDNLTSGNYNSVVGSYSGSKITTGARNAFFGNQVGSATTTGSDNVFIGTKAGLKNLDGTYNTFIGTEVGVELTRGTQNTFIGAGAGVNHGKGTSGLWGNNTFIGFNAAVTNHAMGTYGDGNVVIGSNAPLGGLSTYKLIIDCYSAPVRHDLVNPFIGGDFINRTLSFDSNLQIRRTLLADDTFKRVAVMSDANLIGYKPLSDFTNYLPINGTIPGSPFKGVMEFSTTTESRIKSGNANVIVNNGVVDMYIGPNESDLSNAHFRMDATKVYLGKSVGGNGKFISFTDSENYISVGSNNNGPGIVGTGYWGDHYEDNSFVQKSWVEKRIGGLGNTQYSIPLSGTEPGKPVKGDIEFSIDRENKIISGTAEVSISKGVVELRTENNNLSVNPNRISLNSGLDDKRKFIDISNENSHIAIKADLKGAGLLGAEYYGDNYQDNSFVQKGWVEKRIDGIGNTQGYIPLSGTEPGKPVTRDIEFSIKEVVAIKSGLASISVNNGYTAMTSGDPSNDSKSEILVNPSQISLHKDTKDKEKYINLKEGSDRIDVKAPTYGPGVVGAEYYGDNYEDNSFIQKRWVDERVKPNYKIYRALLQTDENSYEPKFIELENTIGKISWKRNDVGFYTGMLGKAFPKGRVFINSKINIPFKKSSLVDCMAVRFDDDLVNLNILTHGEVYIPIDMGGEIGIIEIYVYD